MNRQRATAVILENEKVLLFHRVKNGKEYDVFPGGGVEEGETFEDALIREIREELSLEVGDYTLIASLTNLPVPLQPGAENALLDTNVYLVTSYTGVPELGGPEKEKTTPNNQYLIAWVNLDILPSLPDVYPQAVLESVLSYLEKRAFN